MFMFAFVFVVLFGLAWLSLACLAWLGLLGLALVTPPGCLAPVKKIQKMCVCGLTENESLLENTIVFIVLLSKITYFFVKIRVRK